MKTNAVLKDKTCLVSAGGCFAARPGTWVLGAVLGVFLAIGTTGEAGAQTVSATPVIGYVKRTADMTVQLLSTPLAPAQRQVLHAQNFNQLEGFERALYLHTVAYAVGAMVSTGNLPTPATLVQHLQTVPSIYEAPVIPAEYSPFTGAHLSAVSRAMEELNWFIAGQIVDNPGYRHAMYAGALSNVEILDGAWTG